MFKPMFAAAATALAGLSAPALAEPMRFFEVDGVTYDDAIPGFDEATGYEIGERPVRYSDLVSYTRMLAERSPNITVETIGYSHEGRPILTFTVTSPDNHARLEDIRADHLARARGEAAPDDTPMDCGSILASMGRKAPAWIQPSRSSIILLPRAATRFRPSWTTR
jgi:hypothetical protein